jgi:hypothetical protein
LLLVLFALVEGRSRLEDLLVVITYAALTSWVIIHDVNWYSSLKKRLFLLEDYRAKYKLLPDSVTLAKIARRKFRVEDIEKLLQDAEVSIMKRGHV